MGCRFFPNEMPDFVEEKEEEIATEDDSLMQLLSMPYSALSERLKRADSARPSSFFKSLQGLDRSLVRYHCLSNQTELYTFEYFSAKDPYYVVLETWGLGGQRVRDFSLYSGVLGTAFLQFKAYQLTNNKNDLNLCCEIIKACDSLCSHSGFSHSRDGTFLCGRAGVCALGAATAKQLGDEQLLTYYLSQFKEIKLPKDMSDELLAGRAGFLWACLFINKHVGEGTIPSNEIGALVKAILIRGRRLGVIARCPLMFEYGSERYWGAAHGLAGIMHVLMHVKLNPEEAEEVKRTLKYVIKKQLPSGNFPSAAADNEGYLVHWCHSAPGIALTFLKAAEVIILPI
ncbi:hypothetical protein RHMOL_Rhmol06G0212600 [Rhododendron molle]|uniref:Uncharacterized protein n=1 Tax=Rhododendron molle TaxID=49168 RepID=A0ACC0NGR5_RHOML|nr:hypothetical protein RHMOL_Rhmol06G0212600 [Rhododendron molle]